MSPSARKLEALRALSLVEERREAVLADRLKRSRLEWSTQLEHEQSLRAVREGIARRLVPPSGKTLPSGDAKSVAPIRSRAASLELGDLVSAEPASIADRRYLDLLRRREGEARRRTEAARSSWSGELDEYQRANRWRRVVDGRRDRIAARLSHEHDSRLERRLQDEAGARIARRQAGETESDGRAMP